MDEADKFMAAQDGLAEVGRVELFHEAEVGQIPLCVAVDSDHLDMVVKQYKNNIKTI